MRILLTTFPDRQVARAVIGQLVAERAVACGQMGADVTSIYGWKGEVTQDTEVPVSLKVPGDRIDRTTARLVELHPYDVPQVLVLAASASDSYAAWARDWCGPEPA